ncbi:hypothetical protein ACFS4T_27380 [Pseudomonas lini]
MRIRVLSAHSGMDALTIFLIGYLPEAVDKKAYADAAEHALLSLSEARAPVVQLPSDLKQLVQMTCTVDKTEVVANKPGEKDHVYGDSQGRRRKAFEWGQRLLERHAGQHRYQSDLDGWNGQGGIFFPGKVTGTDTPTFWLDFFEAEYAPTIRVLFESTSLTFPPPLKSPVPLGVVAQGDEVELYATLMDKYLNPGINSLVRWSVEPDEASKWASVVIRPEQTLTNQQGLTRVFVSSPTGGTFTLSVLSEGSETKALFEPITFGDVTSA